MNFKWFNFSFLDWSITIFISSLFFEIFILMRIKGKGGFTTVHYFLGFLGKWLTKSGCFKPETIRTTRGIIPHNFSSLGLLVFKKLTIKQTNKHTKRINDILFQDNHNSNKVLEIHILYV